jgi:serine phosphatase RsbU (regulator of sigma subunit)
MGRKIFKNECESADIKCKAVFFISLIVGAITFFAFMAIFINRLINNDKIVFIDTGRLLFLSASYFLAFFLFKFKFRLVSKLILVLSPLFLMVYYPIIINDTGLDTFILYPFFIILLGAFTQFIFYFKKEFWLYLFVTLTLLAAIIFTDNIYLIYFKTYYIERAGKDYFVIKLGYIATFIIINSILFFVLKKYKQAQDLAELATKEIEQNNEIITKKNEALTKNNLELKELKEEIVQQNEELRAFIEEISAQRDEIEERNNEIIQSITYARKIQKALIPKGKIIYNYFDDFFVFNKPKDILSGDFLWTANYEENIIVAVADCTGHGVPAALLSVLAISALNEIILIHTLLSPDKILNLLREKIVVALSQSEGIELTKDGLDISIIIYNKNSKKIMFSGAFNPLVIIRNNQIISFDGDRMPVGICLSENGFSCHRIDVYKDDIIYLFTDGYADQFGGLNNKKMKRKEFKELLLKLYKLPLPAQKERFEMFFNEWKLDFEQVDDVLLVGLKV